MRPVLTPWRAAQDTASTSWSERAERALAGEDAASTRTAGSVQPAPRLRRGRSRVAEPWVTNRPRSASRRRLSRRTVLRRRNVVRRQPVNALAGTPEAANARELARLELALRDGQSQGG